MPLYEFECQDGHRSECIMSANDADYPVVCECGKPAKRVVSQLGGFSIPGTTGPTKDDDNDVREARRKHREMCAWGEAVGTLNVKSDSAPTRDAEVTSQDVAKCKAALKRGEKVPVAYRQIAPEGHYDAKSS